MRCPRRSWRRSVAATSSALVALAGPGCGAPEATFDLVVRGGTLVDGTGSSGRAADVAVSAGRIARIGDLAGVRARREIDASGLVVAPGWIDLHGHADLVLLADRTAQERLLAAKIAQGVTTLIVGNCGLGVAPASDAAAPILAAVNGWMTPEGVAAGAWSIGEYLGRLERAGVPLNVGTLVPHGPVRTSAMGLEPGPPSVDELAAMRADVARGLDEGGFGLSTGLIYPPGMYSATSELTALAEVVASRHALFTSHVRGSSETLLAATRELIEIARASGARAHHSHLEAVGERFWPRITDVLALEDEARRAGVDLSHDVFPYTRAATMMSAIFPPWALEGGIAGLLRRLADPSARERIRAEIDGRVPEWPPWTAGGWPHNLVGAVGWDGILVASVGPGGPTALVGRSLAEIARAEGRDPFDVVAELMLHERGQVGQLVAEISGDGEQIEPLLAIMAHPAAAVVSDAEDYGRGTPHPAHSGAFARALRMHRERSLLALEEIVRRMSGYPASRIGLADRGVVREGAWADLVVFDPETVADRSTWEEPRRTAAGVRWVTINGRIVVADARYIGGTVGHVLRAAGGAR